MAPPNNVKGMVERKAHEKVWVFCREFRDQIDYEDGENSVKHACSIAVEDHRHGSFRPRIGLSEGWVPAIITDNFDPKKFDPRNASTYINFVYDWPHWFNCRGEYANAQRGELRGHCKPFECKTRNCDVGTRSRRTFVRTGDLDVPSASSAATSSDQFVPDLAILAFRWGGGNVASHDPSELLGMTNDYIYKFIDSGLNPALGSHKDLDDITYEIWSVFVEDESDCKKIEESFHFYFGDNHPARRAHNLVSMFFLQPTGFDPRSSPCTLAGEDDGAATIFYKDLFSLMQASERCGVPCKFPHSASMYQMLTSKSWTHQLCLDPEYRLPVTLAAPKAFCERSIGDAANMILRTLEKTKIKQIQKQWKYCGEAEKCPKIESIKMMRGVAKLPYSWEALDVKLWDNSTVGTSSSGRKYTLQNAIFDLNKHINIAGSIWGQCHFVDSFLVQEYVPHVVEMRMYFIEGKWYLTRFTRFDKVKENNEFGGFKYMQPEKACQQYLNGDTVALKKVEAEGKRLAEAFLAWLKVETCEEEIAAIRFDFFVNYVPYGASGAVLDNGSSTGANDMELEPFSDSEGKNKGKGKKGGKNGKNGNTNGNPNGPDAMPQAVGNIRNTCSIKLAGGNNTDTNSNTTNGGGFTQQSPRDTNKVNLDASEQALTPREFLLEGSRGYATVTTLEICECGFSCLHSANLPNAVMPAIVNSCLMKKPAHLLQSKTDGKGGTEVN